MGSGATIGKAARSQLGRVRSCALGVALGCVALALLFSALTGRGGLAGAWALEREVVAAERDNFELVQSISRIREEIHALQHDDATLERVARRQAHLVRPGEVLYRLSPANP